MNYLISYAYREKQSDKWMFGNKIVSIAEVPTGTGALNLLEDKIEKDISQTEYISATAKIIAISCLHV